jgi:pimeloyl-ACP methyl ester carboxylesterase
MTAIAIIVALIAAGAVITFFGTRLIERAHPPRGRFVEIGSGRQHVLELGEGAAFPGAPPVVLLHGAGANLGDMQLALGERLSARQHRVILVDRPGLGWSERKGRAAGSAADQAITLRDVLDRLGIARAILVGHSFGGTLALAFALAFPQRVAALVLIAAPTHPAMRFLTWLNAALSTPLGWLFAHTLALPFGAILIAPGTRTAFLPQTPPHHYLRRTATLLVLRPASLLANWADVGGLERFLAEQIEHYGKLSAPTIAVVGDHDLIVPPRHHIAELAAVAPNVKVVELAGFGHMLHHDAADRVIAAIEEVASSLSSVH